MPQMSDDHAIASLGMAVAGTQFYSAALPSVFTIRAFEADRRSIRDGERFATVATLALGAVVSAMLDHPAPLVMAVVVAAVMLGMYEWALATPGEALRPAGRESEVS